MTKRAHGPREARGALFKAALAYRRALVAAALARRCADILRLLAEADRLTRLIEVEAAKWQQQIDERGQGGIESREAGTGCVCPECERPVPEGDAVYDCAGCATDGLCTACALTDALTCEASCDHCGRWIGYRRHGEAAECARCAATLDGEPVGAPDDARDD